MAMFNTIKNQIILTWRLLRDSRVPLWQKAVPILIVLYIVSPLDFVPDIIPVLGQVDDISVLLAGLKIFENMVDDRVVIEHQQLLRQQTANTERTEIDVQVD